jgi:hypothetical protein
MALGSAFTVASLLAQPLISYGLSKYGANVHPLSNVSSPIKLAASAIPTAIQVGSDMYDTYKSKQGAKKSALNMGWKSGLTSDQMKGLESEYLSQTPSYASTGLKGIGQGLSSGIQTFSLFPKQSKGIVESIGDSAKSTLNYLSPRKRDIQKAPILGSVSPLPRGMR